MISYGFSSGNPLSCGIFKNYFIRSTRYQNTFFIIQNDDRIQFGIFYKLLRNRSKIRKICCKEIFGNRICKMGRSTTVTFKSY